MVFCTNSFRYAVPIHFGTLYPSILVRRTNRLPYGDWWCLGTLKITIRIAIVPRLGTNDPERGTRPSQRFLWLWFQLFFWTFYLHQVCDFFLEIRWKFLSFTALSHESHASFHDRYYAIQLTKLHCYHVKGLPTNVLIEISKEVLF